MRLLPIELESVEDSKDSRETSDLFIFERAHLETTTDLTAANQEKYIRERQYVLE